MSHKTAATVAPTIGIDTGKNTLHLIGLDDKGAIVLREKIARGRVTARFANAVAQGGQATSATGQSRRFAPPPMTSGLPPEADTVTAGRHFSEWDGPAVLPPRTVQRMTGGIEARGAHRHVP